ncbi:type VI secretion system baseplate subunit TssF [Salmonella enterica subsp. enterica]|nr:type VI secretion system baseplate subunit TssF [Salmonella enterica subsp. enterica serovar Typhimurium]EHP3225502.1 type VI secretion system baseplate subunit TssF [Salmonella enterica subsp. enterica serovar Newport]
MNKLLVYYQRELSFLKYHGKVFANRYPKIARRLGLSDGETEDPHVSRLIESFALLTSRIHHRLDQNLPEVIDALMSNVAPQFLLTLPSVCIVNIDPDVKSSGLTGKNVISSGEILFTKQSLPISCQMQTIYPVTLLPLSINSATLSYNKDDMTWKLQLLFHVWPGASILGETIRLFLHGPDNATNTLYTMLCSELKTLIINNDQRNISLEGGAIRPVGFSEIEGLLKNSINIPSVHNLLLDYFWFPKKFLFIDIDMPEDFIIPGNSKFQLEATFNSNFLTERLEKISEIIDPDFFRLHCTPAVNLFPQCSEPIVLKEDKSEYPIVTDAYHQDHIDIWSIQDVFVKRTESGRIKSFKINPLIKCHLRDMNKNLVDLFWHSFRREIAGPTGLQEKQLIAFSYAQDRVQSETPEIVTVHMQCSNHSLPNQFRYGKEAGDFDADILIAGLRIVALTHPSRPVSPPDDSSRFWRLISQLSLNRQLFDGAQGAQQLKETLALYSFGSESRSLPIYTLIKSVSCQPIKARLVHNDPHSLTRGMDITVTFEHCALMQPEYYLFCCMLDRFIALYAPVNSFTRLVTCSEDSELTRRIWPIRTGRLTWL